MYWCLVLSLSMTVLFQAVTAYTDKTICRMTPELRVEITDAHNLIRNMFACGKQDGYPEASCMNELVWDADVEAKALEQSATKLFEHDKFENRFKVINGVKVPMGQNLGMAEIPKDPNGTPNYTDTIWQFYRKELSALSPNYIEKYPNAKVPAGHLTQVIWGRTTAVGCGTAYLENSKDLDEPRDICLLSCNYAPPGNFKAPIYIADTFDSKNCIADASSQYSHLCAPPGYLVNDSPDNQCPTGNSGNTGNAENTGGSNGYEGDSDSDDGSNGYDGDAGVDDGSRK